MTFDPHPPTVLDKVLKKTVISLTPSLTSVRSYKSVSVSDGHPDPYIGPQVYLNPIKKHKNSKSLFDDDILEIVFWTS